MCIIILDDRKDKIAFPRAVLERAFEKNPDGMGIMYAIDKQLYTWTSMDDMDSMWARYQSARLEYGVPVAMHFRVATVGSKAIENCHPIRIRDGLSFMHNGTISEFKSLTPDGMSDSVYLSALLRQFPVGFVSSKGLMAILRGFLVGSRLLFMNSLGQYGFVGESSNIASWYMNKQVWVSKKDGWEYIRDGKLDVTPPLPTPKADPLGFNRWSDRRSSTSGSKPSQKQRWYQPGASNKARKKLAKKSHFLKNILFSYGSLRRDPRSMPSVYEPVGTGILHDAALYSVEFGGGAEAGVVLLPGSKRQVHGELFYIKDNKPEDVLDELDMHEGAELQDGTEKGSPFATYHRRLIQIDYAGHEVPIWAWVYIVNGKFATLGDSIVDGDWSEWIRRRVEAGEADKLFASKAPEARQQMVSHISKNIHILIAETDIHRKGFDPGCPVCQESGDAELFEALGNHYVWCNKCQYEFKVKVTSKPGVPVHCFSERALPPALPPSRPEAET